jgi:gamma-glutamylcyclotransferase (GGCT)/AIG2-like uncharacterized protein YtfP
MAERCPGAKAVGPGTLDDHELAFAGESRRWRGGVATVVRRRGGRVPGMVYALGADDLARLDRLEGAAYRRVPRALVGPVPSAMLYRMPGEPVRRAPSAEYLAVIDAAYARLGFDRAALARAADARTRVFVYGTLLSGEANHHVMAGATPIGEAATRPAYDLFDLGEYPGIGRGGRGVVAGEVYEVDASLLRRIDAFEGHPHLFARGVIGLADGDRAFAYVASRAIRDGRPRIESGSWRHRAR